MSYQQVRAWWRQATCRSRPAQWSPCNRGWHPSGGNYDREDAFGLAHALGETIAVAMVCGAAFGSIPSNIYATMTTIASTVVLQLDAALTDSTGFAVRTLAEISLVLMVITLATNVVARLMVRRAPGTALPSIVLGYVGYVALVVKFHWGYGLLPAVLVLSVIAIRYITKATETSLAQVPSSCREGAEALGLPGAWKLRKIVLKSALPGIVTGLLLATGIVVGETAPLLTTAGWSESNPTLQLTNSQVGYLTCPIWTFFDQPNKSAVYLSYDAALLLLIFVLLIIIAGRVVIAVSRRHAE